MNQIRRKYHQANSKPNSKRRNFILDDPDAKRRIEIKEIEESVRKELKDDMLSQQSSPPFRVILRNK